MGDRRLYACDGKCGKAKCRYKTRRKVDMKRHIKRLKKKSIAKKCLYCAGAFVNILGHVKRIHPDKYVKLRLKCPFPKDPHGWAFIKHLVIRSDSNDKRKLNRWSEKDRAELLARDNKKRHDIAVEMYVRWQSMGDYDDAGGFVQGGLHLRKFSLHQLSPDRICNQRPHFVGNKLDNINLISLGMNTQCNMVSIYGSRLCHYLREKSKEPVTDAMISAVLEREKKYKSRENGILIKNRAYVSCHSAYHRDGKLYFKSVREMFTYAYSLLVKQQAICSTTCFLMDCHAGKVKASTNPFQPSLNTIAPSLGHRPGNLEWVCAFVNATDHDKRNDMKGLPTGWTRSLFKSYIGV